MDDPFHQTSSYLHGIPTPSGTHSQPLTPHQSATLPPQRFRAQSASTHQLPPLPPLGNATQFSTNSYGSAPQTPLTPQTPASSAPSLAHNRSLPTIAPHPPLHTSSSSSYFLPHSNLSNGQSLSGLTSSAHASNVHAIAPSSMTASLQDIRPMPAGGIGLPYNSSHLMSQPPILPNQEPEPIHVVGQQGRRGVLPTANGRPAPGSAKAAQNLTKNADNKYECPHCNKTYLHLKHLKRHLLRRKYPLLGLSHPLLTRLQTPASGPTNATFARILSRGVTFSSATSRSARYAVATRPARTTLRTLRLT